jgi:hypothetical protein
MSSNYRKRLKSFSKRNEGMKLTRGDLIQIGVLLFSGALVGRFFSILVHEIGHFTLGYIFNKEAIEGMYFYPEKLLTPDNFLGLAVVADVKFKGDIPGLYSGPEAGLVFMGGLIFQFALLLGVVLLLNRARPSRNKACFKVFCLGLGFYLGMSNIIYSWWQDAVEMSLANGATVKYVFAMVSAAAAVFYLWFLIRYIRLTYP